jgi:cold shock CspA family protein
MVVDHIKTWNKDKGFGHTRGGVFVHVSALDCEHLAPTSRSGRNVRNFDLPLGTVVVLETQRGDRGLRATTALCAACGAPGRWARVVCRTATHPVTGEVAEWVRYDHVSGSYRDQPKADNSAFDRVAAAAQRFRGGDSLFEDEFGPASFVRLDLDWSADGEMAVIRHAHAREDRKFPTERLLALRPEWFAFSRIVFRREGTTANKPGRDACYVGERRAKAFAVFILPSGQEWCVEVAETRHDPRRPPMWHTEFFRVPASFRVHLAHFEARMKDPSRLMKWFLRTHGEAFAPVLARYQARMAVLTAPNSIVLDVREGSWREWASDDWLGRDAEDGGQDTGDYVAATGTIYTYSCEGAEVAPVVQCRSNERTLDGVRKDFTRAIWRDLESFVTARVGDGSWTLLGALSAPYPG